MCIYCLNQKIQEKKCEWTSEQAIIKPSGLKKKEKKKAFYVSVKTYYKLNNRYDCTSSKQRRRVCAHT